MQQKMAKVVVIGGGPAGLMAAETIADAGYTVAVYDAMPSVGRKFLLAGKGGMNLTHAEEKAAFLSRYASSAGTLESFSLSSNQHPLHAIIDKFDAQAVCDWAKNLGIATFVGSSGRVFPVDMKAAPLLRAWLHRMRQKGVQFNMRQRWLGWSDLALHFQSSQSEHLVQADAVVLALGGASWARLGSDGAWQSLLQEKSIAISALEPANCGFEVAWSEYFRQRFAGHAILQVAARVADNQVADNQVADNQVGDNQLNEIKFSQQQLCAQSSDPAVPQQFHQAGFKKGQFVMTEYGVEGSLIYALSRNLREAIKLHGSATLELDLLPDWSSQRVLQEVMHPRGSKSLSSHLKSRLKLDAFKFALLHEVLGADRLIQSTQLALALKALPLSLIQTRPIDEAISSAGGICFEELNPSLMLDKLPGVFAAGEMLDWEAPTGGYLLTACLASGKAAGQGVADWLAQK